MEEDYYIIYGLDSDALNITSDSIPSVSNTSLENQTYSILLDGLDVSTVYFAQIVAAFGMSGEYKRYSETIVFRTKEYGMVRIITNIPYHLMPCFLRTSCLSRVSVSH